MLWGQRRWRLAFAHDEMYGLGRRALRLLRLASLLLGGCCGWRWLAAVAGAGAGHSAGYWMLSDVGVHAVCGAVAEQGWRVRCCNFALHKCYAKRGDFADAHCIMFLQNAQGIGDVFIVDHEFDKVDWVDLVCRHGFSIMRLALKVKGLLGNLRFGDGGVGGAGGAVGGALAGGIQQWPAASGGRREP